MPNYNFFRTQVLFALGLFSTEVHSNCTIYFVFGVKWAQLIFRVWYFVCVEVLRPSQPNGVMSSVVSLPNHTFTGQALSSKRLTSIVHILSPETDNCPS